MPAGTFLWHYEMRWKQFVHRRSNNNVALLHVDQAYITTSHLIKQQIRAIMIKNLPCFIMIVTSPRAMKMLLMRELRLYTPTSSCSHRGPLVD